MAQFNELRSEWQAQSIAAQHRQVRQVNSPSPLSDYFDISRREQFAFPNEVKLAVAFDDVPHYAHATSTFPKQSHQIEKELVTVVKRAFERYFLDVVAMQPQSYPFAASEARQRGVDYLGFMRVVHWEERQLIEEAHCKALEKDGLTAEERRAMQREIERQNHLTFVEPISPRGIQLPQRFKRCIVKLDQPFDQVLIHFWWVHLDSGQVIDGGRLLGKSGWLTFQNDTPANLLQKPLEMLASTYVSGVK